MIPPCPHPPPPAAVAALPFPLLQAAKVHEGLAFGDNERYCFLVVKDGALVHETYWGNNNKDSTHTTYSVGKTAASLLTGVAVGKGILDIDRTLKSYGVEPQADFGPFFKNATTRHFLSQSSGEGRFEPGTKYMYDSRTWINHISKVLGKVTGEGVGTWATKHLTGPLGMPAYWANQPNDVSDSYNFHTLRYRKSKHMKKQ